MSNKTLIDYWSYSSMGTLLRNPLAFKKKYILQIYDDISSPSSVVGKAGHKALEAYYKEGMEVADAIALGLEYINNMSDAGIDYGKTGSRENILKTYDQAIRFYFEELQQPHEILGVEQKIVAEIQRVDGEKLALPAKGFMDLVTRNKLGEIEIIDHKFVRSYSDGSVENFNHFLQAMFNYHLVKAEFGEAPARIIFNECKISKNRDNTPQIQPYTIEFEGIYGDFATFYKLFDSCTEFISREDAIFLPNPNDIFDGQNTFDSFRLGVIGVDRPATVQHKTEQVKFVEKNFIESASDKIENQHLTPEEKIRLKLQEFAMPVKMEQTYIGPSITKYTLKPSRGVPMSKIAKMGNDLALALEADSIRIEAPIRGTSLVGVEVANKERKTIELATQHLTKGTMKIPIGIDVYGETVKKDLAEMPHLLIAGATGSGKSVMLNVLLESLSKQMDAKDLEMILVDPKQVELAGFGNLPHLAMPVVHETEEAIEVLQHAVQVMEDRYTTLAKAGVRSIDQYKGKMTRIVIVIDEFADLMMMGGKTAKKAVKADVTKTTHDLSGTTKMKYKEEIEGEVPSAESLIVRIAQKARAVGIHLVLATQRPSADVVTGLIKANVPTKIAFMTTSKVNSQIILDQAGAEELTGKGDMLFLDPSAKELKRLQGLYA
jgi:RecB family exonuclease